MCQSKPGPISSGQENAGLDRPLCSGHDSAAVQKLLPFDKSIPFCFLAHLINSNRSESRMYVSNPQNGSRWPCLTNSAHIQHKSSLDSSLYALARYTACIGSING